MAQYHGFLFVCFFICALFFLYGLMKTFGDTLSKATFSPLWNSCFRIRANQVASVHIMSIKWKHTKWNGEGWQECMCSFSKQRNHYLQRCSVSPMPNFSNLDCIGFLAFFFFRWRSSSFLKPLKLLRLKCHLKKKRRQRNELWESMVSHLSMYPCLSSLGKQASGGWDHRLYFEFVCYQLKAFFKGDV